MKDEKFKRNSFTYYQSFYEASKGLEDKQFGSLMRAVCEFALYGEEIELAEGMCKGFWTLIKPVLQSGRNKSHKDSGRPKSNQNQTETKTKSNRNQNKRNPSIEGEGDAEVKGDIKVENDSFCSNADDDQNNNPFLKFRDYFNERVAGTLIPRFTELTPRRQKAFELLKSKYGSQKIMKAIDRAIESDYLIGEKGHAPMKLDWFLQEENFIKCLEGQYND